MIVRSMDFARDEGIEHDRVVRLIWKYDADLLKLSGRFGVGPLCVQDKQFIMLPTHALYLYAVHNELKGCNFIKLLRKISDEQKCVLDDVEGHTLEGKIKKHLNATRRRLRRGEISAVEAMDAIASNKYKHFDNAFHAHAEYREYLIDEVYLHMYCGILGQVLPRETIERYIKFVHYKEGVSRC